MAFKKGQSGNPGGRPKEDWTFRDICRKATDEKVIKAWLAEVESMGDNWMKASELLAAYGYGKPAQSVEVSGKDGEAIKVESSVKIYLPDNGRGAKNG